MSLGRGTLYHVSINDLKSSVLFVFLIFPEWYFPCQLSSLQSPVPLLSVLNSCSTLSLPFAFQDAPWHRLGSIRADMRKDTHLIQILSSFSTEFWRNKQIIPDKLSKGTRRLQTWKPEIHEKWGLSRESRCERDDWGTIKMVTITETTGCLLGRSVDVNTSQSKMKQS